MKNLGATLERERDRSKRNALLRELGEDGASVAATMREHAASVRRCRLEPDPVAVAREVGFRAKES